MLTKRAVKRIPEQPGAELNGGEWLDLSREATGARLQMVRMEKGFTQADFARRLGISRPSYYYYEKGKRALSTDQLAVLGAEFKVDLNWLVTGDCAMLNSIDNVIVEKLERRLDDYIARSGIKLSGAKRRAIFSGALRQDAREGNVDVAFLVGMLR